MFYIYEEVEVSIKPDSEYSPNTLILIIRRSVENAQDVETDTLNQRVNDLLDTNTYLTPQAPTRRITSKDALSITIKTVTSSRLNFIADQLKIEHRFIYNVG